MRILLPIAILSLAAVPAVAQGIVIPIRCEPACPADGLPRTLSLDSVKAWANLEHGVAMTYVDHAFRNETTDTVHAAFFFPLPADAAVYSVSVVDADLPAHDRNGLLQYNEWSRPDESRWIAEGLVRDRGIDAVREFTRTRLVHVPVRAIPPGGRRHLQISYMQPLRMEDGTIAYRYPLSVGANAAPIGELTLGMTVKTDAGFRDLRSPSHAVDVQWGTEPGPCHPRERCGVKGYASHRVRVVRLVGSPVDRTRDFEIVYTPEEAAAERRSVSIP